MIYLKALFTIIIYQSFFFKFRNLLGFGNDNAGYFFNFKYPYVTLQKQNKIPGKTVLYTMHKLNAIHYTPSQVVLTLTSKTELILIKMLVEYVY